MRKGLEATKEWLEISKLDDWFCCQASILCCKNIIDTELKALDKITIKDVDALIKEVQKSSNLNSVRKNKLIQKLNSLKEIKKPHRCEDCVSYMECGSYLPIDGTQCPTNCNSYKKKEK